MVKESRTCHHRSRGDQVRHREDVTMEELGGAMTTPRSRASPRSSVRTMKTSCNGCATCELPALQQPGGPARLCRHRRSRQPADALTISCRTGERAYDMHEVIRYVVDDGEFLEVFPLWAMNVVTGFARLDGHSVGVTRTTEGAVGNARLDRARRGESFRAVLRRLQHADPHLGRRAGVPPRTSRIQRDNPPRREAPVRLRRGHRARMTVITRKAYGGATWS